MASSIGWQFNKGLAITAGYTGVPGSRSLVNTFPFFTATDRSMADNFFRPGFTQGAWANGEPVNGLNTLSPLESTFDHGAEVSVSCFAKPKKVLVYGRGSWVRGQFGDSHEYGGGVKWFFLPTERLWLSTELFRVSEAPYSGAFTPYTAGTSGWVPMLQTVLAF